MFTKTTPPLDIEKTLAELKTDSTYNLSVVLVANSLLKDNARYSQTRTAMQIALDNDKNDSFKAWMLGRVALAAVHMQDTDTQERAITALKDLLPTVAHDEMRAWALGYIAAVNEKEYNHYEDEMLAAANALTKPADALWAHVMNLQAASRANARTTYDAILQQMKAFTKKDTIAEALAEIPTNDWHAWALGITINAAATIGDNDLHDELNPLLPGAILKALKEGLNSNAILAKLTAASSETLINQHSFKRGQH